MGLISAASLNTSPKARATPLPSSLSTSNASSFFSAVLSEWSGVSGDIATSEAPRSTISGKRSWSALSSTLQ